MLISQTLPEFYQALLQEKKVICTDQGQWCVEGDIMRFVRFVLNLEDERILKVARVFTKILADQEKFPVNFSQSHSFKEHYSLYCAVGNKVISMLEKVKNNRDVLRTLQRQLTAFEYRIEQVNGGENPEFNLKNENLLLDMAQQWKQSQPLFKNKAIQPEEATRLKRAAQYSKFIPLINKDPELKKHFFRWTIRHHNQPDFFIQYPNKWERFKNCFLSCRFGYYGSKHLNIEKISQATETLKVVTCVFEGRRYNVLDESLSISFRGGIVNTIAKIFDTFQRKWFSFGDFEFFEDGICNWNIHKLGWKKSDGTYHQIDLKVQGWWQQMPCLKTLSLEEVVQKYHRPLNPENWIISLVINRETLDASVQGMHSYLEILIPNDQGQYIVYSFGKYPVTFPTKKIEYIWALTKTFLSTIVFPDENIFYNHRDHKRIPVEVTPEKGMIFMESIRKDILKALDGNLAFQFVVENCFRWSYRKTKKYFNNQIPNLPDLNFFEFRPQGILKDTFLFLSFLPRFLAVFLLNFILYLFGASQSVTIIRNHKIKKISLLNLAPWKSGNLFYHPSIYFHT